MTQSYLDFKAGDIIAFVLTIFSTILAIVPMVELPTDDHSSDEIYRLRAVDTIANSTNNHNSKIQPNQLLWAYNKLHDMDHVIYNYKNIYNKLSMIILLAQIHKKEI